MRRNCWKSVARKRLPAVLLIGGMIPGPAVVAAELTESDVLAGLAGKVMQPGLEETAVASQGLAEAARLLCRQKDADGLKKARKAWREAYLAWRNAQPMMLEGKKARVEQLLENWPANEVVLDGATGSRDLADLLNNIDVRGFSGAEYLLFAPPGVSEATTEMRCVHLQSVVDEIAGQAERNRQQWRHEAGPFVAAGDGKPYLLPGDALSLVFARMINVAEQLLRDRLCAPSGFFEGTSKPDMLESWRSDTTRKSIRATIAGFRRILVGDGKDGITALVAVRDGLVSKKNPQLAADIGKQLETIDKRLDDLDDGILLHEQLGKDDQLLHPLYKSIEDLQELIIEASLTLEVDVMGPGESQMQ